MLGRQLWGDRWISICPSCFDAEAELTDVRYEFIWYASDMLERPGRTGQEATPSDVGWKETIRLLDEALDPWSPLVSYVGNRGDVFDPPHPDTQRVDCNDPYLIVGLLSC